MLLRRWKKNEPSATNENVVVETTKAEKKITWRNSNLKSLFKSAFSKTDQEALSEIEDALLMADVGVEATSEIVAAIQIRAGRGADAEKLQNSVREVLIQNLLEHSDRSLGISDEGQSVILVVGVNGAGKTTTIGKLAYQLNSAGKKVVVGAADTFRAAAADQLETWASRSNATIVRGNENGDPASVAFDTVAKGIELAADVVIVDTAGRLQNKSTLMEELSKISRVIERQSPITEVLLVLDATTGQNGLNQAEVFAQSVPLTGIVLTKFDGTAKGGVVFAIQNRLGVPVKLVGVGESAEDLITFDPVDFVESLLA